MEYRGCRPDTSTHLLTINYLGKILTTLENDMETKTAHIIQFHFFITEIETVTVKYLLHMAYSSVVRGWLVYINSPGGWRALICFEFKNIYTTN